MLGGCDLIGDDPINDIIHYFLVPTQVISQGMELDEHWREIIPDPPLKVSKDEQKIIIRGPGDLNWSRIIIPGGYKRRKGPVVIPPKIEVQIVSEQGTIYLLNRICSAVGIGFSYFPEDDGTDDNIDRQGLLPPSQYKRLPKDVVYTKVRIRSEKSVKTGEISWIRYSVH